MIDKIVIDIETKNTFADVGGRGNVRDLEMSLIGLYSYTKREYCAFSESEFKHAGAMLQRAGLLIGFSINRFDVPILASHFPFSLASIPTIDLLEEIEFQLGHRVSLDVLARANLGIGKTHQNGLEAIRLYREGKMEELKKYCLNDVKITKELYELAEKQSYLLVPERESEIPKKAALDWREKILDLSMKQTLF